MRKAVLTLLSGCGLVVSAAVVGTAGIATPTPAEAGISTGTTAGSGLRSFVLRTALASSTLNSYDYYPYAYYIPTYYTPPAPVPRTCWRPQYNSYYTC